jgi:hypothetical protein
LPTIIVLSAMAGVIIINFLLFSLLFILSAESGCCRTSKTVVERSRFAECEHLIHSKEDTSICRGRFGKAQYGASLSVQIIEFCDSLLKRTVTSLKKLKRLPWLCKIYFLFPLYCKTKNFRPFGFVINIIGFYAPEIFFAFLVEFRLVMRISCGFINHKIIKPAIG